MHIYVTPVKRKYMKQDKTHFCRSSTLSVTERELLPTEFHPNVTKAYIHGFR